MALPAKSLHAVCQMNADERWEYFTQYARYDEEARKRYAIRVGSIALRAADTHELRLMFEAEVKKRRRQLKLKVRDVR